MKKHILLSILIATVCSNICLAQKKDKKAKKDTVKVAVPDIVEEKVYDIKEAREGVKDMGDDVAVPMVVEEAPRYYGSGDNRYHSYNRNEPTSKSKLDDAGLYYLIRENIAGSYQAKYGVQDSSGKTILPTVFSSITKTEKNYIIKLGSLYGVLDASFNTILPTEFDYIDPLGNGLYIVRRKTGGIQLVDNKGIPIISNQLKNAVRLKQYNNKPSNFLQLETHAYKRAIYNIAKKKFETGFSFRSIISFDGGLILNDDSSSRIVDTNFHAITKETFTNVLSNASNQLLIVTKKNKKGLLGIDGKYLLPCEYDNINAVANNGLELYITVKNGKYSFIDYTGKNLFGQTYDFIGLLNNSSYGGSSLPPLLHVKSNGKSGVKDVLNHSIIPVEYDTVYANYGNYYLAQKPKKLVRFTQQGKLVNEITCDSSYAISYESRVYLLDGKMGLLNTDFEQLTQPVYSNIEQLGNNGFSSYSYSYNSNAYLKVTQNGKMGLINRTGNIVLPVDYELVEDLDRVTVLVKQKGKYGLFRTNDLAALAPCEYDMIGAPQNHSSYEQMKYVGIKAGEVSYISFKP